MKLVFKNSKEIYAYRTGVSAESDHYMRSLGEEY